MKKSYAEYLAEISQGLHLMTMEVADSIGRFVLDKPKDGNDYAGLSATRSAAYIASREAQNELWPEILQLRATMQDILTIAADNVDKGDDEWLELIWHLAGSNCPDGKYWSQEAHKKELSGAWENYLEMKAEDEERIANILRFVGNDTEE